MLVQHDKIRCIDLIKILHLISFHDCYDEIIGPCINTHTFQENL